MQKRISAASATLNSHLQACLEGGLQRRDTAVIYHCLRAYASIDNAAGAEEAFRAAIVAPFVAELVPGGQAKGAATLADVYAGVREHIERDCKFLLEIVDQREWFESTLYRNPMAVGNGLQCEACHGSCWKQGSKRWTVWKLH